MAKRDDSDRKAKGSVASSTDRALDSLTAEFDALLARMQTPTARERMRAAFDSSPKQLGKAAVRAALKSG